MTGQQVLRFHELVTGEFARAVRESEQGSRLYVDQNLANLSAIPGLALGHYLVAFGVSQGGIANRFSPELLLGTVEEGTPKTIEALTVAASAALRANTIHEVIRVSDSVISFMRKETLKRGRLEARAAALPVLDICLSKLQTWEAVPSRSSLRDREAYADIFRGLNDLRHFLRLVPPESSSDLVRILSTHPRANDANWRQHVKFANSDSPELRRLAATFYSVQEPSSVTPSTQLTREDKAFLLKAGIDDVSLDELRADYKQALERLTLAISKNPQDRQIYIMRRDVEGLAKAIQILEKMQSP